MLFADGHVVLGWEAYQMANVMESVQEQEQRLLLRTRLAREVARWVRLDRTSP